MTGTWSALTADEKELVRQAFDALHALDDVRSGAADDASQRRIGFSDLYALATDPDRAMTGDVRRALAADPDLSEDLHRLLAKTAAYRLAPCAAASTGPVFKREGSGFSVSLHPSRAEPSQVYVIIDVADTSLGVPSTLFVCEGRGCFFKFPLPESQGRSIQVLAESESDLVRALRSPGSEVFLR